MREKVPNFYDSLKFNLKISVKFFIKFVDFIYCLIFVKFKGKAVLQ